MMLSVKEKPLIIVTGPTASGKSSVAVELALKINGAVVSADSVQIYKGMDIGSAKITPTEMKGVEHFLISRLEPDEEFNVSEFVRLAESSVGEIYASGRIPIITGGTAFYIQAFLKGVDFSADTGADTGFRELCEAFYENPSSENKDKLREIYFKANEKLYKSSDTLTCSKSFLYELLKAADPEYAALIHKNNLKRIIRALEYFKASSETFTEYNKREAGKESRFKSFYFLLEDERESIYERINKRVDEMLAKGLEREVRALLKAGCTRELKSMQSIGYKEMCDYIYGECSLEAAVENIKKNTRHFAKRQLTWFRRERDVISVDIRQLNYDAERIAELMLSHCISDNNR